MDRDVEFISRVYAKLTDEDLKAYRANDLDFGSHQNRPRLKRVAEYCVQHWPGDLIEIGLLHGNTTIILAEVASRYGRRVVGVDPFDSPRYKDYYQVFLGNTKPWRDIIDIIKLSSTDPGAIAIIKARELCFAYVDGLHEYEACYSDIRTVGHCNGIIAVDDIHVRYKFAQGLLRAFYDGAALLNRVPMDCTISREGYLVPRG